MVAPTDPPSPAFAASSPGYGGYGYAVARRDPTAVMGRRIGAFFIDLAVFFVVAMLVFVAVADRVSLSEAERKYNCDIQRIDVLGRRDRTSIDCPGKLAFTIGSRNEAWVADGGALFGLDLLFSFAYYALLPGLTGWTLGKLLVGLRIVDARGVRAGLGRNVVRWLLFVAFDGLFLLLPGLISSLTSKGHRRTGDMAAGTYVVPTDAVGTPPMEHGPPIMPPAPSAASGPAPQWTTPPWTTQQWPTPQSPTPAAAPPPASQPAQPPAPPTAPPPQWDDARKTYLQWDPSTGTWLQWDEGRRAWKPIDT